MKRLCSIGLAYIPCICCGFVTCLKFKVIALCARNYAKKAAKTMASKEMVHQETLRYVNPFARISIDTDIQLRVSPIDVHTFTSGDVLIAQLRGDAVKNCTASLKVDVTNDDKDVSLFVRKLAEKSNFICDLKIPLRAEVNIKSRNNVQIEGIYGEAMQIEATGNIHTKQIRATTIALKSETGNIQCDGTLLGKCIEIQTKDGLITLDKLQGDSLWCKTENGGLRTNSCYVLKSKFETDSGCLALKNVHKECEVYVRNGGELNMTGVHGNIMVQAQGGRMNLQLSELEGKCVIVANDQDETIVNISEIIQNNALIQITAKEIKLDSTLLDVSQALSEDKRCFKLSHNPESDNELIVQCSGTNGLCFGKQSWADTLRNSMGIK